MYYRFSIENLPWQKRMSLSNLSFLYGASQLPQATLPPSCWFLTWRVMDDRWENEAVQSLLSHGMR